MKKAFLDQMLLGWIALMAVVVFVATVIDERNAKDKYHDLEDLSFEAIKTLSRDYYRQMQGDLTNPNIETMDAICAAENLTDTLLRASDLGTELLDSDKITYVWRDTGSLDVAGNFVPGAGDGFPDTVSAVIESYEKENFWYKFLDKDSFTLPGFTRSIDLNNFTLNTSVTFRGVIEAGYFNMVGTYEIGDDGCPKNGKLILDNKNNWEVGENLAEDIDYPTTKMFFIADGYRRFGNFSNGNNSTISLNSSITFDNPSGGCDENSRNFPNIQIRTDDGRLQSSDDGDVTGNRLTSRANIYFEDEYLNFDNKEEHIDEVAEKDWGAFVAYMERSYDWNAEAWEYANSLSSWERNSLANSTGNYDGWRNYVNQKGLTPDFAPDNQYVFVSEDLASTTNRYNRTRRDDHDQWNSDNDFSDMSFSMIKLYTPNPVDVEDIDDGVINVRCE